MKRFYFLLLTLLCSSAAISYSFTFDQLIKTPITDVKFAPFIVGGLGVLGFSYCAKDLWTVGKVLYKGDDGIAALKVHELQQNLAKNRHKLTHSEKQKIEGEIEVFKPGLAYGSPTDVPLSFTDYNDKISMSLVKMNPRGWKAVHNLNQNDFVQLTSIHRNTSIDRAKAGYEIRAMHDFGGIVLGSVIAYASYWAIKR